MLLSEYLTRVRSDPLSLTLHPRGFGNDEELETSEFWDLIYHQKISKKVKMTKIDVIKDPVLNDII